MSEQITAQTVAQKLLEFYGGDENKWTQGAYARNSKQYGTGALNDSAVCWCLVGAICYCYNEAHEEVTAAHTALVDALAIDFLPRFNDRHTFKEVTAKLQEIAGIKS